MSSFPYQTETSIAMNRFGLGARPGGLQHGKPRQWLISQFDDFEVSPAAFASLADAKAMVMANLVEQRAARKSLMSPQAARGGASIAIIKPAKVEQFSLDARSLYRSAVQARALSAIRL